MASLRQIAAWHIYEQQFSISIRLLMGLFLESEQGISVKFQVICMLLQWLDIVTIYRHIDIQTCTTCNIQQKRHQQPKSEKVALQLFLLRLPTAAKKKVLPLIPFTFWPLSLPPLSPCLSFAVDRPFCCPCSAALARSHCNCCSCCCCPNANYVYAKWPAGCLPDCFASAEFGLHLFGTAFYSGFFSFSHTFYFTF